MQFNGQAYIGERPAENHELVDGVVITYRAGDGSEGVMVVDPKTRKMAVPPRLQEFLIGVNGQLTPINKINSAEGS